jgi:hypothetical protein
MSGNTVLVYSERTISNTMQQLVEDTMQNNNTDCVAVKCYL